MPGSRIFTGTWLSLKVPSPFSPQLQALPGETARQGAESATRAGARRSVAVP